MPETFAFIDHDFGKTGYRSKTGRCLRTMINFTKTSILEMAHYLVLLKLLETVFNGAAYNNTTNRSQHLQPKTDFIYKAFTGSLH